jgi:hypothetical protein
VAKSDYFFLCTVYLAKITARSIFSEGKKEWKFLIKVYFTTYKGLYHYTPKGGERWGRDG